MWRTVRNVGCALAASTIAALAMQASLSGTYSSIIEAADVTQLKDVPADQFVGKWTLTFAEDGTYTVQHQGVEHIKGTFALKGETLTLTDRSGDYACLEGDAPAVGEYRLKHDGKLLIFTAVKDAACPGRAAALTLKPYTAEE